MSKYFDSYGNELRWEHTQGTITITHTNMM